MDDICDRAGLADADTDFGTCLAAAEQLEDWLAEVYYRLSAVEPEADWSASADTIQTHVSCSA